MLIDYVILKFITTSLLYSSNILTRMGKSSSLSQSQWITNVVLAQELWVFSNGKKLLSIKKKQVSETINEINIFTEFRVISTRLSC